MGDNKVVRASIWYTISSFLLKGVSFFTTPIFSRILTQEEYGVVNNFNAWLAIITVIGTFSLSASLVRARFDYEKEINSYIKANLLFGSAITGIIFCFFLINASFWTQLFVLDEKCLLIMGLTIIVTPAYDMFIQVQQYNYKYKTVTVLSILVALANIVFSFIFIWIFEDNLFARILGSQLPVIIIGIILYMYFVFKGQTPRMEYLLYSIPMCVPYMVHLLSGTLLSSSDRVMITKICGASETALYGMAYNIALIVNVIWTAMNNAFTPWLGEKLRDKNYSAIKKYSYGYVAIFIGILIGVMLIAPEVLWFFGGERYDVAKYVIPPVMMGYMFIFMYSLYVNIEQFEKKTIGMAVCTVLCALVNLGFNYLFVPVFGYIAAAYTTLFGYFLMFVAHYCIVRRMKLEQCYDIKFLIIISLFAVMVGAISLLIYDRFVIRIILIVLYASLLFLFCIKNKRLIIGMLRGNRK